MQKNIQAYLQLATDKYEGICDSRLKSSWTYLVYVFEKWVERCKKCIVCQGRYFGKETVTALPRSSDSE
jgi:hypothetical protein